MNNNYIILKLFSVVEKSCDYPSFTCDVSLNKTKCLSVTKLCDGFADCKDFSDEGLRCGEKVCSGDGNDCSDLCQNSPDGRRCHCPPGSHLVITFLLSLLA